MIRQFRIEMNPVPASRPRIPRFGKPYYDGPYKAFNRDAPAVVSSSWGQEPLKGWLRTRIAIYGKRPKKPANPYPHQDWDNFAKAVCDAMNGIVYVDDKQIVSGTLSKQYAQPGEAGHIIVTIEEIDE